ncbi:MAG: murB [Bacteroidetes bacterium]|nr:murB [Bacteroidota bacterium]
MVSLFDIRRRFKGTIKLGEPLANYASLGIGGPADYLFAPSSREDCVNVVTHLRESAIPFLFVGRGSNLLVSDPGYRGAMIMLEPGFSGLRLERTTADEALVHAAAGARLARLVDFCIEHALQGVETLAGIPGTVGGLVIAGGPRAIRLPDGCLAQAELLRDAEVIVTKDPEKFSYRRSGVGRDVVLGATFHCVRGNRERLMRLRRQLLIRRNMERPLNVANAGFMFRDAERKEAAGLVREAGMQGFRQGAAAVSERHANMLLNLGNATAADALNLIRWVQRAVREKSGIQLALAIRLAGFEEEPMREVA